MKTFTSGRIQNAFDRLVKANSSEARYFFCTRSDGDRGKGSPIFTSDLPLDSRAVRVIARFARYARRQTGAMAGAEYEGVDCAP